MNDILENDMPMTLENFVLVISYIRKGIKKGYFTVQGFEDEANLHLEYAQNKLEVDARLCARLYKSRFFYIRTKPEEMYKRVSPIMFNVFCFILRRRTEYLESYPRPDNAITRTKGKTVNDCIYVLSELVGFYKISRFSAFDNNKVVETIAEIKLDESGNNLLYSEATCYRLKGSKKNNKFYFKLEGYAYVTNEGLRIQAEDKQGYWQQYNLKIRKINGEIALMIGSNDTKLLVIEEMRVINRALFEALDVRSYSDLMKEWREVRDLKPAPHLGDKRKILLPDGGGEFRVAYF
ncbi:MAG: hypothetical protein ABJH28_10275 [Paraglaciecola sp.]|uniref:hypothetical protein n=1 Tax=Paraglaciecola sp. TaxID=1920173 RepID=UPI003267598E